MRSTPPGERPEGRAAGTQRWRQLAFIHREVEPDAIAALLPEGLEVDRHEGRTYVGVVPFAMREIRSGWMPRFAALDFLETNVRCYVRCRDEPGVFFFSLDASSRLAVRVARLVWGLPYIHARMSLRTEGSEITAESVRTGGAAGSLRLRYRVAEALGPSAPGTLEHFLLERYVLFSQKRGRLFRGQVYHPPYPIHAAELLEIDETLLSAAGLEVSSQVAALHYSPGVDVEVFSPVQIGNISRYHPRGSFDRVNKGVRRR